MCVCKLFFFVKDFAGTAEPRILKFGTNVGYNLLYCVRENQPPPAYHSLYLSFPFLLREICVKDFSGTTAPRILKFGTNVGYDLLHCVRENQPPVRENQPPDAYHFLYLSIFLSL